MALNLQKEITLNHPIEEVFAFIADPLNDPLWCRSVKEMKQVKGNGLVLGAQYVSLHNPGDQMKKPMECEIEVVEFEAPRYIRWKAVDKMHDMDIRYQLVKTGEKTQLTQISRIAFAFPYNLVAPLIKSSISKEMDGQFEKLREVLQKRVMVEGSS